MPKITLFQNTNFGGKYLTLQQADSNLKDQNFNDITSAVIVCSGSWILYQDADFKGQQWVVTENGGPNGDGLYPSYNNWNGKNDTVSSVKPL
jgi:hypothetical protein